MDHPCAKCGADGASNACGKCDVTYYCNAQCKKKDRKKHAKQCGAVPLETVEAPEAKAATAGSDNRIALFSKAPKELTCRIIDERLKNDGLTLKDILRLSLGDHNLRSIVLGQMKEIGRTDLGPTIRNPCWDVDNPHDAIERVEAFFSFLERVSGTIQKLFISRVVCHYWPKELHFPLLNSLTDLYIVLCRDNHWKYLAAITANTPNVTSLTVDCSINYCRPVGCRCLTIQCQCYDRFTRKAPEMLAALEVDPTKLTYLSFGLWDFLWDDLPHKVKAWFGRLSSLTTLDLSRAPIENEHLELFVSVAQKLEKLMLNCKRLHTGTFAFINATKLPLTTLHLIEAPNLFDGILFVFIDKLPLLSELYIDGATFSADCLLLWAQKSSVICNLKVLVLKHLDDMTDDVVDTLIRRNPNLERLCLAWWHQPGLLTDDAFKSLNTLQNLRSLTVQTILNPHQTYVTGRFLHGFRDGDFSHLKVAAIHVEAPCWCLAVSSVANALLSQGRPACPSVIGGCKGHVTYADFVDSLEAADPVAASYVKKIPFIERYQD